MADTTSLNSVTLDQATTLDTLVHAVTAGITWATTLNVGDLFLGAMPAAKARYHDTRAQRLFMFSALNVLDKHRLCTAADGTITEYSLKTGA